MALAWQGTRPFPVSAIFGATTSKQLEHLLTGAELSLSDVLISEIDHLNRAHPMPY
jgi:aryl-alcohol dehydrogenase-like predicted oxidoreductase